MSNFRDTPTEPGTGAARPATTDPNRSRDPVAARDDDRSHGAVAANDEDRWEHERIGIHNEAETIRRDRIRWGPVWAGIVTAVGMYLILQLGLIASDITDIDGVGTSDAVASGIAALIAFFLGGLVTGASAMWQGIDDGILHGIVMWFAALVAIIVFSAIGSGLALGSFDTTEVFGDVGLEDVDAAEASDEARDAAGRALLVVLLGLAASAAGGAVGAKLWPKDDVFVDVVKRKDGR